MSKMGQIHDMAMNEKEEELEDYLEYLGWRPGASSTGAKFFIEAAQQIKAKEEEKEEIINDPDDGSWKGR